MVDYKHEVDIMIVDANTRVSDDEREKLLKHLLDQKDKPRLGVVIEMNKTILKKMINEYVDCPVLERHILFAQCFICPNFRNRIGGKVLCKGEPIKP